jgi:hypothetical protein
MEKARRTPQIEAQVVTKSSDIEIDQGKYRIVRNAKHRLSLQWEPS